MEFYTIPQKNISIEGNYDIIIAGGGTAGTVAAIAAARSNKKVLLIESSGSLGGAAVGAIVTPMMHIEIEGNPMCSSISDEINKRMVKSGFGAVGKGNNQGYFDPMMLSFLLEEMAVEAGVKLLYYTSVTGVLREGNIVTGVIVENKKGTLAYGSKAVIDCTGDGDAAFNAGVPFESGNPEDGFKNQPISVRYIVSNIDLKKFFEFLHTIYYNHKFSYPIFQVSQVWNKGNLIEPVFKRALEQGDITYEDGAYWQAFGIPGRKESLAFNCPEIFTNTDGTNPEHLTEAQITAKKAILRQLNFYKKYFEGFEDAYVSSVANQVGIRESRRFICTYYLSDEDVLGHKKFKEYIARSNYSIDIHGITLKCKHNPSDDKGTLPYYEIPYQCLVPKDIDGILLAGRCISASFLAESSIRVQPTMRALGEAAGIAAAIAIDKNINLREVNGVGIRIEMQRRGAKFE